MSSKSPLGQDGGEGEGFRQEVRSWLASAKRPEGLRAYGGTPDAADVAPGRKWHRTLAEAGYACLHWPTEFGGRAATAMEQAIFAEEAAKAGVPTQLGMVGPNLAGPVIMQYGTAEQKSEYLPPIISGEHLWCQLFSEPGAGSDLASVRTRVRPLDDGWAVDGQKVWTSAAKAAQFGLLLARTGSDRYKGLTAFIVPMDLPGILVRPLEQMDGEKKFNEVFLSDVKLGPEALLGQVGEGWRVATATLGQERLSLGSQAVGMFAALDDLIDAAAGKDRLDDVLADKIVQLWSRVWILRATWLRAISTGDGANSPTMSVLKLMASEVHRDLGDLATDVLGMDATVDPGLSPIVHRMLVGRAQTILGGTSEIQRNILSERVLGLPREPAL
ncbi:acyl-CoA dehydrogenase family protein [Rhodococcoides yunnanense]|uniref:Acyl-CoA dehydrogenase family protein n=1 Tax=Rhodococcoides yunnanense TaxID=278209 RepID=A0ABU4BKK3_9NOCA|nr:acyl-CoA dehydrogenase family protein [Rhodococcus yunnanensis]MDV6264740.1 acyl-CoA dehydrogenase family protein [Rhodococcus yunnanensis]